ncbi:Katanin p60 atpase-containing subunit, partial [Globisporangium splendens]
MQAHELREMGESLTKARELCHEAQYERGLALYESTLQTLRQWIRQITKMAERQPWLQMQIDLENEFSLISDCAELTQAFKIPLGTGRIIAPATKPPVPLQQGPAPVHPRSAAPSYFHQDELTPSPRWEIRTPESKGRDQNPVDEQGRDPDVWAPPSPDQFGRVHGGGPAPSQRAPPSWASDNANNGNRRVVKPSAGKLGNGRAVPASDRPSGRRTPSEDQQRKPRPSGVSNEPSRRPGAAAAAKPAPDKDGSLKAARRENAEKVKLGNGTEKPRYSEIAREEGMVDLELIKMIERDATHQGRRECVQHNVLQHLGVHVGVEIPRRVGENGAHPLRHGAVLRTVDHLHGRDRLDRRRSWRRAGARIQSAINGVGSGDSVDPNNRVMVLAATNLPWELDEVMRRRLTKRVYIPLPGAERRRQLFKLNLERVDVAPDVDFEKLIAETEGYSGDDICGLCETAKVMPVRRLYTPEVLKELHRKKQEGSTEDELKTHEKTALENVSKSVGQDQLERFVKWEEEFGSK